MRNRNIGLGHVDTLGGAVYGRDGEGTERLGVGGGMQR